MVKFDDDFVLKAGAVMAGVWAAPHLVVPNEVSDRMYTTKVTRPALTHAGIGVAACSACSMIAANSSDKQVKKDTLKVQGAASLACAATNLWSGLKDKTQNRDLSIAGAVPLAAVGIASLVMGFRD